jgi:thiol-disulfide isomerase/thioredoxin
MLSGQELAPPFTGQEIHGGGSISLSDYRGKVVFIDFWASWCPPCLASLPAYDKMYRELGNAEFEFIAINVDEDTEDGIFFLEDHPVSYPVLADPEGDIRYSLSGAISACVLLIGQRRSNSSVIPQLPTG